jgi:hypothetical protein
VTRYSVFEGEVYCRVARGFQSSWLEDPRAWADWLVGQGETAEETHKLGPLRGRATA